MHSQPEAGNLPTNCFKCKYGLNEKNCLIYSSYKNHFMNITPVVNEI